MHIFICLFIFMKRSADENFLRWKLELKTQYVKYNGVRHVSNANSANWITTRVEKLYRRQLSAGNNSLSLKVDWNLKLTQSKCDFQSLMFVLRVIYAPSDVIFLLGRALRGEKVTSSVFINSAHTISIKHFRISVLLIKMSLPICLHSFARQHLVSEMRVWKIYIWYISRSNNLNRMGM